jgi:SAM-dependent methyltransferase
VAVVRDDLKPLLDAYTSAFAAHGPTAQGLLWPNAVDMAIRYETLLRPADIAEHTPSRPLRLLDLGCGTGLLLDYLAANDLSARVDYTGIDIRPEAVAYCRGHWPEHHFEIRDVRAEPFAPDAFDHCLICGVFTGRFSMSSAAMERMARETLAAVWPSVTGGLSFNTMSKHVDWERDDLFHWALDDIMKFAKLNLSRHVAFRLDYGLWEVAVSVRKAPVPLTSSRPAVWLPER